MGRFHQADPLTCSISFLSTSALRFLPKCLQGRMGEKGRVGWPLMPTSDERQGL